MEEGRAEHITAVGFQVFSGQKALGHAAHNGVLVVRKPQRSPVLRIGVLRKAPVNLWVSERLGDLTTALLLGVGHAPRSF